MTVGEGKSIGAGSVGSGNPKKNAIAMPACETRRRVKLYALNAEKQWDDKGTGHVTSSYVDRLKGYSLLVRAELDGSILLESKIQPDTTYQKQQETLIVWSEGENYDLALSFQERAGCDEIWEKICQVQGKDPSVDTTQDIVDESEDERFSEDNDIMSSAETTFNLGSLELPPAEMGRLEEIDDVISSSISAPVRREKIALALENDDYLRKLMAVFRVCEDVEDIEGLHHLYAIVKNLFLMNKTTLIEMLLHDDLVFDVIGCLEYDPANKAERRKHRKFLKDDVHFHQIVPTTNKELNAKIHQTYRAQYLHDVALPTPSFFEDNTSTLSSFIFFNKVDIVTMIQKDEQFLTELFAQLTNENTDEAKRRDLVLFLKELCSFSQTLQPLSREQFLKALSTMGILPALEIALCMENQPVVRSAAIDILNLVVEFSPSLVREYMMTQAGTVEEEQLFSNVLIEVMMCDSEPDMSGAFQLQGIFKIVLDPENMLAAINKSEKTDFLTYFYKHSMHVLTAPLLAHTAEGKPGKDDYQTVTLLSLIVELMAFCVDHHTFHIKNYIIGKDLLRRVLVLLKSTHKCLALCALRLMRKILALKDTFYHSHIVEKSLFEPVIECLIRNKGRYNLLDSAILEMFEFVKSEIQSLYSHVIEKYGKRLESIDYAPTFRDMRKRFDDVHEKLFPDRMDRESSRFMDRRRRRVIRMRVAPTKPGKGLGRFRRDPREPDEDEALWFDAEDEEDTDSASAGPHCLPAVSLAGGNSGGSPCSVLSALASGASSTSSPPSLGQNPSAGSAMTMNPSSPPPSFAGHGSSAGAGNSPGSSDLTDLTSDAKAALLKSSLLCGKRGLVDYDGDSDDEDMDRDDGDADCEDDDDEDDDDIDNEPMDEDDAPADPLLVNGLAGDKENEAPKESEEDAAQRDTTNAATTTNDEKPDPETQERKQEGTVEIIMDNDLLVVKKAEEEEKKVVETEEDAKKEEEETKVSKTAEDEETKVVNNEDEGIKVNNEEAQDVVNNTEEEEEARKPVAEEKTEDTKEEKPVASPPIVARVTRKRSLAECEVGGSDGAWTKEEKAVVVVDGENGVPNHCGGLPCEVGGGSDAPAPPVEADAKRPRKD